MRSRVMISKVSQKLQLQHKEAHSKDSFADVDSMSIETKHMWSHIGVWNFHSFEIRQHRLV